MDIAFVILNYISWKDTILCVNSIREMVGTDKYGIVIVDNASPDNSWKEFNARFSSDKNIHLILTDKNLGYAKGNNVGFKFAKENWNPKFMVVLNGDTKLIQKNFYQSVLTEFNNSFFAVMGPMILTKDGRCDVNPVRTSVIDKDTAYQIQRHALREYRITQIHLEKPFRWLKKLLRKKHFTKDFMKYQIDVQLHGSFLIFSSKYIDKFDGFNDKTFLYHEEELLFLRLIRNHLKSVYQPGIIVYHKEDSSSDAMEISKREKKLFVLENLYLSSNILLDEFNSKLESKEN